MKKSSKILIVEDENFERKGLKLYLEKLLSKSLEFYEAISGNETIEIFLHQKPNIVLMDIKIPRIDGLSAARKMKKLNKDVNIIISTGFNEFDFAKKAIKLL